MRFWPATDPVQLEYELLREMALAGTRLVGLEAERFQLGGLVALLRRPRPAAPRLVATLIEVPRPPWSPWTASEAQSRLAGGVGKRPDPAVEQVSAAVEDASLSPAVLCPRGKELACLARLVHGAEIA